MTASGVDPDTLPPTQQLNGACCDLHNEHCEPPGDLCCPACTEVSHDSFPIRHADGTPCVLDLPPSAADPKE